MNGGSNNLILQETTSAGAALAPAKIPVVIAEGTASETLRMDANGISVKTNAAPTAALDVNGRVISTNFLVKGSAPKLVFHDTVTSGIVVGAVYMDASELLFGSLDNVTTMGGVSTPLRLSLLPGADGALVIASDKKATFGGDVTVTGSVTCAGAFYLGPTSTPAGTSDGYNGQVSWDTNYLYVCTTTGTGGAGRWKRVALSSF